MFIQELSRDECLSILAGARIARLACVHGDQPYIVPVNLIYDTESSGPPALYGVTTLGTKVEWMRANPRVSIEVDEVTEYDRWVSVVVLGRFEELTDQSGGEEERLPPLRHPGLAVAEERPPSSLPSEPPPSERHRAFELLRHQAMWWEPASTAWASRQHRDPEEPYSPVYYRVWIEQVTGHRALPQAPGVTGAHT